MREASIRKDIVAAPTLFRAYQRVLVSPLFPASEISLVEDFVDLLPKLHFLIEKATQRNLAVEITNVICNSWSANMRWIHKITCLQIDSDTHTEGTGIALCSLYFFVPSLLFLFFLFYFLFVLFFILCPSVCYYLIYSFCSFLSLLFFVRSLLYFVPFCLFLFDLFLLFLFLFFIFILIYSWCFCFSSIFCSFSSFSLSLSLPLFIPFCAESEVSLQNEDMADVKLFFSHWEDVEDASYSSDDSQAADDDAIQSLLFEDPGLALRRLRRRHFSLSLTLLVQSISETGPEVFFNHVDQAQSFSQLPELYILCLKRFFSLLRLLLLDGLKQKKNRVKAARLLSQVLRNFYLLIFICAFSYFSQNLFVLFHSFICLFYLFLNIYYLY
jgi:hypothetical protein